MDAGTKNKIVVAVSVGGACALFTAGLVLTILICRNRKMLRKRARERRLLERHQQVQSPQYRATRHSISVTSQDCDSPMWTGTREATPARDWQHRNSTNYSWARDASTNRTWGSNSVGVASWNCSRETSPHSPAIGQTFNSWAEPNSVSHTINTPTNQHKRPASTSDWSRRAVIQSFDRNTSIQLHHELIPSDNKSSITSRRLLGDFDPANPPEWIKKYKESSPYRETQSPMSGLFIPCDTQDEDEQVDGIYVASLGRVKAGFRSGEIEHSSRVGRDKAGFSNDAQMIGVYMAGEGGIKVGSEQNNGLYTDREGGIKTGHSSGSRVSDSGISSSTGSSTAWWLHPCQSVGGASGDNVSHKNLEQILQSIENYSSCNKDKNSKNNSENNNNTSTYIGNQVLQEKVTKPYAGLYIQSPGDNAALPNHPQKTISSLENESTVSKTSVGSPVTDPHSTNPSYLTPYWSDSFTSHSGWTFSNPINHEQKNAETVNYGWEKSKANSVYDWEKPGTGSFLFEPERKQSSAELQNSVNLVEFDLKRSLGTSPINVHNAGRPVSKQQRFQTRKPVKTESIWRSRGDNDSS